jgi:hypothetical protein
MRAPPAGPSGGIGHNLRIIQVNRGFQALLAWSRFGLTLPNKVLGLTE